jgi:hypothetical protein
VLPDETHHFTEVMTHITTPPADSPVPAGLIAERVRPVLLVRRPDMLAGVGIGAAVLGVLADA